MKTMAAVSQITQCSCVIQARNMAMAPLPPILKGPVAVVAARPVVVVASDKAAVSVLPCPCPRFSVRWARTCALAAWRRGAVCR